MVGRWLHGFSELLADGSRREAADGLLLAAAEIPHLHCLPLKLAGMAGGSSRVDPLWEEEEEEEADQTCVPLLYPGKTRRVTTIPPCRPHPSTLHMESERRRLHRERCLALHAPSCGPAWACSGDAMFGLKIYLQITTGTRLSGIDCSLAPSSTALMR